MSERDDRLRLRAAALLVALIVLIPVLVAAAPLFPTPLHITRQVYDPISESTTVVNEYGYGNRLVAIRGGKTSIADYEKGELIEIDREAGTYSITRFDELAKAAQAINTSMPSADVNTSAAKRGSKPASASLRTLGAKISPAGRTADFFSAEIPDSANRQTIEVGVDRSVVLSREALEVLLGSAYPGTARPDHEIIFNAAAARRRGAMESNAASDQATYALPIEQVSRYDFDGRQVEFKSSVTRVGSEPPPADLIAIPAGARLVVSRTVAVQRELEQLDHPAAIAPRNP